MLTEASFHINDVRTQTAIRRLRVFQKTGSKYAIKSFPAMPINDGIAYFVDLKQKTNTVAADFLKRAVDSFYEINRVDKAAGHPGARMVIAVGPRARIGKPQRRDGHLANIFERLRLGEISQRQAVQEAFSSDPVAGFVPSLQANFAFTRAYLANEAGSRSGLGGPNCYIDLTLFQEPPPAWIHFSRFQAWKDRGLEVTFGELESVDWRAATGGRFSGLRSTSDLASLLIGRG